jgi:hypothetical protein
MQNTRTRRTPCSGMSRAMRMHRLTTSPGPFKALSAGFLLQSDAGSGRGWLPPALHSLLMQQAPHPLHQHMRPSIAAPKPDSHVPSLKCEPTPAAALPRAALSLPQPCEYMVAPASASSRPRWGSQRRPVLAPARRARPCTPCAARPARMVVSADRVFAAQQDTEQPAVAPCAACT